jgi:hypothetical protein
VQRPGGLAGSAERVGPGLPGVHRQGRGGHDAAQERVWTLVPYRDLSATPAAPPRRCLAEPLTRFGIFAKFIGIDEK